MPEPLPMMSTKEVDIVNSLLETHKPKQCLEWGSGLSTIYWNTRYSFIDKWIAVEHNLEWYVRVLKEIGLSDQVRLFFLPNTRLYYHIFNNLDYKFDFILVDGILREECLNVAKNIVSKDGFVLLHDSGRSSYRGWFDIFPHYEELIEGENPLSDGGYSHRGLVKLWI